MSAINDAGAFPAIQDHEEQQVPPQHQTPALDHAESIKQEDEFIDTLSSDIHVTPLRPDLHSDKIPESQETEDDSSSILHVAPVNLSKKRKRAASPPWQFGVAEQTTIKTTDGRRSSARVNASSSNTPGLSESEGHGIRNSRASSSRLSSPPWKQFKAEGPTSTIVDGVRKSGRVNKETSVETPKRVSPRSRRLSAKQEDEMANGDRRYGSKRGEVDKYKTATKPGKLRRKSSQGWDRVEELKAQIADLTPRKAVNHESDEIQVRPRRPRHGTDEQEKSGKLRQLSPDNNRKSQRTSTQPSRSTHRIMLRFSSSRHAVPPPHPHAEFPTPIHPPQLPTVAQIIDEYELKEMQYPYLENERGPPSREEFERRHLKSAEQEAGIRRRILEAAKPNGVLSEERCSIYEDATVQIQLAPQYNHHDHLVAHALHLRSLQQKEEIRHRQLAKRIAGEALEYWKKKRGPTEEDLIAEAFKINRLIYKQVVIDIRAKWDLVLKYVDDQRRVRYEAEQEIKRQEKLQKQLAWSKKMVARQRGEMSDDTESGEDLDSDMSDDVEDDDSNGSEEDSDENMSDEESDSANSDSDEGPVLEGAALEEYLAQRETDQPAQGSSMLQELLQDHDEDQRPQGIEGEETLSRDHSADEQPKQVTTDIPTRNGSNADVDHEETSRNANADTGLHGSHSRPSIPSPEADDEHGLSSDESVDMDSEDYDSDEDMSDSESAGSDAQSVSSEEQAPRRGLLGFFSKSDLRAQGLPTPVTSAEGEIAQERDVEAVPGASPKAEKDGVDADDTVMEDAIAETVAVQADEETMHALDAAEQSQTFSRPDTPQSQDHANDKTLVPIPSLLRGTLRSYQHAGLDWLASLYRNGTNGILADEMGLGKTIQTISLFAHIAENFNVWDAHLVIVPTSVILNWVTEFQKFLPGFRVLGYYGTTEERAAKRKGWINDPHHDERSKRGYNVVITSYNVALKDINAIRHVQWHYMVLDEAHNIRNFNSQRFQNLIKLKTRARLLLTGTPLQNSLTELWSLLTFLTAGKDDSEEAAHGSLEEFLARWKEPVNEIFDRGVQALSDEASKVVTQLHTSLRPFMLRRLKVDVEKDLPKKTEHVVVCKLSKRQRQLYQDYMGLSDTRAKLTQGNAISAGKVLLSLRRVCNHPDLFDPRPIQTSYALEKSALDEYSIKERAVRRLLGYPTNKPYNIDLLRLESDSKYRVIRGGQLSGVQGLRHQLTALERDPPATPSLSTIAGCQAMIRVQQRQRQVQQLRDSITYSEAYFAARPLYGAALRDLLTTRHSRRIGQYDVTGRMKVLTPDQALPLAATRPVDKLLAQTSILQQEFMTVQRRADEMHDSIARFTFCTPEVVSPVLESFMAPRVQSLIRAQPSYQVNMDPLHEARMRTSIVFPDSQLLIYDSGKLQRLTTLLRDLQSRGSRSLIFTQMSGSLNILEQFLNLMNLPYLRLDGSTPVERRQLYTAEFNKPDSKYQCMILSSRAGGVGLNLTGASSVIFYDLDWNPQMDKQCMDRAHRIGQVRDVEVYKMVSEKTVEENILRRANQKSLLDQTVIQEGNFTTDHGKVEDVSGSGGDEDVAAAIDRFLSGGDKAVTKTIESVEDKEDVQAAQQARKEELQDEEDFAEHSSKGPSVAPSAVPGTTDDRDENVDMEGHIDSFMIRTWEDVLRYIPYAPPKETTRDPSHRKRKRQR